MENIINNLVINKYTLIYDYNRIFYIMADLPTFETPKIDQQNVLNSILELLNIPDLILDPYVKKQLEEKLSMAHNIHEENVKNLKLINAMENAKQIWFDEKYKSKISFTEEELNMILKDRIKFCKFKKKFTFLSKNKKEMDIEVFESNKKHKLI